MSFNGSLEHIPLVDVIQLLHMTSKTGILHLKCPRGESQLVFHEGYFVSANHLNNSLRIGTVLVEMGAITAEQLDQALSIQKNAGKDRKPLIAVMIENGIVDKDNAYKGLENLIEMTIVEVMTWSSGTFSLDVSKEYVSDEYRYFPEKLHQEILLNAQGVLMDALRIYDEKMRDGTLSKIFFDAEPSETVVQQESQSGESTVITADLLGLDDLDTIKREIPAVFSGLQDHDPAEEQRKLVACLLPEMPPEHQEQLVSFLSGPARKTDGSSPSPLNALILLTSDNLLSHAVTTFCRQENLFAFSTDDEASLDVIIEQNLGRELHPVLLVDAAHAEDAERISHLVRQRLSSYTHLTVIISACPAVWGSIGLPALAAGVRSIVPRPCRQCHGQSYVEQLISFTSSLGQFLNSLQQQPGATLEQHFSAAMDRLKTLCEPPDIALALLSFAALQFERAITLVVGKAELIAEKSIGVSAPRELGPAAPMMLRLPLEDGSLLKETLEARTSYFGQRRDRVLTEFLHREIGAPRSPRFLILPLLSRGKVIALTYADFGGKPVSPLQLGLLEALALYAGAMLDNALYRKSIEKPA